VCCRAAKAYSDLVDRWFEAAKGHLDPPESESEAEIPINPMEFSPMGEAPSYEGAIEVIRWYQHFIYLKLMRAIQSRFDEKADTLEEFQKDSDGSAKIALIAIDRSMAAWRNMHNHFLAREGDILKFQKLLGRVQGHVEKEFPQAREFIRPGFDKIDLNS
jgi:hypothetical protein